MSLPLATLRRHAVMVWVHDRLGAMTGLPATQMADAGPATSTIPAAAAPAFALKPPVPASAAQSPAQAHIEAARKAIAQPVQHPIAAPGPAPTVRNDEGRFDARHAKRVAFARQDEAENYLNHWRADIGAMRALRQALQRAAPGAALASYNDAQVVRALAAQLAQGALVLSESTLPVPPAAGLPSVAAVAVPEAPAVPLSMALAPVKPPELPILPLLEEVQIEGAEVMPEIVQTLEQVDLTMESINLASVSLEPTPSKIPAIQTALTNASGSVTSTLDSL